VSARQRSRITAATDAFYLRMRHRDAWSSAQAQPSASEQGFDSLRGHKYCLLTTFRKSGEPVPTPVWFGLADDKLYFVSEPGVGKIKRIRNDPRVRVAACTVRGKPLGPPAEGRARVLAETESDGAEQAIANNYGLGRKLYEAVSRRMPIEEVHVEVTAAAHSTSTVSSSE
jgi:PPOX class probable F420-dependent enzyme